MYKLFSPYAFVRIDLLVYQDRPFCAYGSASIYLPIWLCLYPSVRIALPIWHWLYGFVPARMAPYRLPAHVHINFHSSTLQYASHASRCIQGRRLTLRDFPSPLCLGYSNCHIRSSLLGLSRSCLSSLQLLIVPFFHSVADTFSIFLFSCQIAEIETAAS